MEQINNASVFNGSKDNPLSQVRKKVFSEKVAFSVKVVFDSLIKLAKNCCYCIVGIKNWLWRNYYQKRFKNLRGKWIYKSRVWWC